MWSGRSRLFSTGKFPVPPPRFSGVKGLLLASLGSFVLYESYTNKESAEDYFNQFLITMGLQKNEEKPVQRPELPKFVQPKVASKTENSDSGKYKDLAQIIENIKHNELLKQENEENEKRARIIEEMRREKLKKTEKQEKKTEESTVNSSSAPPEKKPEENSEKTQETPAKDSTPQPVHPEPTQDQHLNASSPIPESLNSSPTPETSSVPSASVVSIPEPEIKPVELLESSAPVPPVSTETDKTLQNQALEAVKPSYSSSDLDSMIHQIRADLSQEQEKREKELFNGIEDLFKTLISEYLPRSESSGSPARIISSNIDFSKMTSDQIHRKFEELINAYQDRLETLGVRNYDSFIERLKLQKEKWRQKMLELQDSYEKQIENEVNARDEKWKKVLYEEAQDSESHYETQAKIDADYIRQETELELSRRFKEELDFLTETLEKATKERLAQLEDIMKKIREMEVIQADHYEIIIKLTKIHKLHVSIENIQKALISDSGNLTEDLKVIINESKNSETIRKILEKIEPVYTKVIISGIPKIKQIQKRFEEQSANARRATLIFSGDIINVLMSRIAIFFIPDNIRTLDEHDSINLLKSAEEALTKGNLARAKDFLLKLNGLPAEEMKEVIQDIDLRLSFTELVESLSANSIQSVQQIVNSKALY